MTVPKVRYSALKCLKLMHSADLMGIRKSKGRPSQCIFGGRNQIMFRYAGDTENRKSTRPMSFNFMRPSKKHAARLLFLLFLIFHGCSRISVPPPEPAPEVVPEAGVETSVMVQVNPEQYPRFSDDMGYDGLARGIGKSLSYLGKLPEGRLFFFGRDSFSRNHVMESLRQFLSFVETAPSSEALGAFLAENYRIYRSSRGNDDTDSALFTGYYEPLLSGSLIRSEKYPYPIYGRPEDLVSVDLSLFSDTYNGNRIVGRLSSKALVPYHDREEIDFQGALSGKAAPIAWVGDPVDLFFLHIQGSGKISLEDGNTLNVHYHASNGRPYRSIGKALIDSGKISREEMSMQAIREYVKTHPEEAGDIFGRWIIPLARCRTSA